MDKKALREFSTEDLEKELERREYLIDPVDVMDWSRVIKYAKEYIDTLDEEGYELKDFHHYMSEAVLETIYGKGIFKFINSRL